MTFKDAAKSYLAGRLTRRQFVKRVSGLGLSAAALGDITAALAEPLGRPADGSKAIAGSGGDICIEQLKQCGVEFVFANPSTGSAPLFDALVDREDMQVILCPHEAPLMAMATGYAKASGKVPFVTVSPSGLPNTLGHMFNAWRDRIPILVTADPTAQSKRGSFGNQEVDDLLQATQPFTRWRWESRRVDGLATDIRRCMKFTRTPPYGPVFLSIPEDLLSDSGQDTIVDLKRFSLSDQFRPDRAVIQEIARKLLAARSPLLYLGDEVFATDAEDEVVELAEMLSLPTVQSSRITQWANNFPTDHPLHVGAYPFGRLRYPPDIDVVLNLGGNLPVVGGLPPQSDLIEIRSDIERAGRVFGGSIIAPGNVKLAARDLIREIPLLVSNTQLQQLKEERGRATAAMTSGLRQSLGLAANAQWNQTPVSTARVGAELNRLMDPRGVLVHELDGGAALLPYFTFAKRKKGMFTQAGGSLGWAIGAAAGVKLAMPDRQVVAICGDGAFLFGGSQAFWTLQRYRIPVVIIVLNNRSYDAERGRIFSMGTSRQAKAGKDMACYLGDPDVEYTYLAKAYGIEGVKVEKPEQLTAGISRAIAAERRGRSFLVEILTAREGPGSDKTWYPRYSVASRAGRS